MSSMMISVIIQLVDRAGRRIVIAIAKAITMTAALISSSNFIVEYFILWPMLLKDTLYC
jgi:hypothetical protein